ncbi:MAG: hypothetical protein Q4C65_11010 [Eubacteriales bacterium]|nr:hypothetical protein [Eubacteriales bacterium]
MRAGVIRTAALCLMAALLMELTVCQFSFWTSVWGKGEELLGAAEQIYEDADTEQMERIPAGSGSAYTDGEGYLHVSSGSLLLRVKDFDGSLKRLYIRAGIPEGRLVHVRVFVQDEGNSHTYALGEGRTLTGAVPENGAMKLYPYGQVQNLYVLFQTADASGEALPGQQGELVLRLEGLEANGRLPFVFRSVRALIGWCVLAFLAFLRPKSPIHQIAFSASERRGRCRRLAAVWIGTGVLLLLSVFFVRINPACRENLALHHAQYQELARAMAEGKLSVGEADEALLTVQNPYDTIFLQAAQIPYQADYAYYEGNYYVYFGVVPAVLLYLPYHLLTGGDLPNYAAELVFFAGFVIACSGLVCELMRRYFPGLPFYFWGIGTGLLLGCPPLFYLLIRPDLYHVPIAASCCFAAAGLWLYLAGLNRKRDGWQRVCLYGAGSLCLALTAGCRPQFILFALLALPLFWRPIFGERALFSGKGWRETAALVLPYVLVAAGLMAYNGARFGSPFEFGAAYSLTSNDMTHRGVNLERILYGLWYFFLQPPCIEASFPYLRSVSLETDYLGRMVTESWFGGAFSTGMLLWPLFLLGACRRGRVLPAELSGVILLSVGAALVIGMVDANGAGILLRYGCDVFFGLYLAAVPALFAAARLARRKNVYGGFLLWLRAAVLLQAGFLFLVLVNTDGSVNLLRGNPELFYRIRAALFW